MSNVPHQRTAMFGPEHFASEYERYAALVLARVPQVGRAATARVFADSERRELLALPERCDAVQRRRRLDPDEVEPVVLALGERAAELDASGPFSVPVFRNVEALGERLALAPAERALLCLAVVAESVHLLRDAMDQLSAYVRDRSAAARACAALLAHDPAAMQRALAPQATLARTGLVRLNLHDEDAPLISARAGLTAILFDEFDARHALFSQFARPARAPHLCVADFAHLEQDIAVLTALLAAASQRREPGVNVMLYGPSGTGKTELARVLASQARLTLHEVRHSGHDGEAMRGARYSQVLIAQRLLASAAGALLMFDETEDLLPTRGDGDGTLGKAAFNDLLETNPVPMIWISNEIGHIDPAYLRRFAFLLEVKNPSRSVRRRIVERAFGALAASEQWIDQVTEQDGLAPAQIAQAARVADLVRERNDPLAAAERALAGSMRALDQRLAPAAVAATRFDLRYLNCNADMAALIAGLAAHPSATLLLFGPPGTGKTALAAHIARVTERPLLTKRASDLLSPWIGVCERNIARAFEQARDEGAVLTLEEAESFLADRRDARARWELTETNELLTQMERFDGLFVCSTNLLDRLDRAAMRRFAVKLRFDYLRPDQAHALVAAALASLGLVEGVETACVRAAGLRRLTPGDVAAALRRCRLLPGAIGADGFVQVLCQEIELKGEGAAQRIGF